MSRDLKEVYEQTIYVRGRRMSQADAKQTRSPGVSKYNRVQGGKSTVNVAVGVGEKTGFEETSVRTWDVSLFFFNLFFSFIKLTDTTTLNSQIALQSL